MTAFVANTNLLDLVGLQSASDSQYVNDASVSVTVVDSKGVEVTGATWPLTMSYLAASKGNYRAALPAVISFVAGREYTAVVSVDAGNGNIGQWNFRFYPATRR
jgi:hypothetical protein